MFRTGMQMTFFRVISGCTIALLASGLVLPASAPAARPPQVAQMAGTTVIRGHNPAVIPVRLPRPATVSTSYHSNPDLKVEGRGRFVGFALVPDEPDVPTLLGGRLPKSSGSHLLMMPVLGQSFHNGVLQNYAESLILPQGNYRLYLLPGSSPAKITLKLHGLVGTTELRPKKRIAYKLLRPEIFSPSEISNYYSAGSERELASEGLIFQALWLRADAHLEGVFHFCQNNDQDSLGGGQLPGEVAYGPGCGGAGGGVTEDRRVDQSPHVKLYYEALAPLEQGVYGQGFYFATASMIEDMGHIALWLGYK